LISQGQIAASASRSISSPTSKGGPTIKKYTFHRWKKYKRKSTT